MLTVGWADSSWVQVDTTGAWNAASGEWKEGIACNGGCITAVPMERGGSCRLTAGWNDTVEAASSETVGAAEWRIDWTDGCLTVVPMD